MNCFIELHAIQRISNDSRDAPCGYNDLCNCRVVRKPVNTNPQLTQVFVFLFLYKNVFVTAYDMCSLCLFEL